MWGHDEPIGLKHRKFYCLRLILEPWSWCLADRNWQVVFSVVCQWLQLFLLFPFILKLYTCWEVIQFSIMPFKVLFGVLTSVVWWENNAGWMIFLTQKVWWDMRCSHDYNDLPWYKVFKNKPCVCCNDPKLWVSVFRFLPPLFDTGVFSVFCFVLATGKQWTKITVVYRAIWEILIKRLWRFSVIKVMAIVESYFTCRLLKLSTTYKRSLVDF